MTINKPKRIFTNVHANEITSNLYFYLLQIIMIFGFYTEDWQEKVRRKLEIVKNLWF